MQLTPSGVDVSEDRCVDIRIMALLRTPLRDMHASRDASGDDARDSYDEIVKQNELPSPSFVSTDNVPPWLSKIRLAMYSP